jgi:predicted dehydrogenase
MVTRPGQAAVVLGPVPSTGYDAEWQQVASVVLDGAAPLISVEDAAADVALARRIVDHALAGS